jgi:hypothetical protein
MICTHCAEGGDLSAELRQRYPSGRPGGDTTQSNRYNGMLRRINNAHGRCKGCDCQHVRTPHYRPPSREATVFSSRVALVTSPVMSAPPAKRKARRG